MHDLAVSNFIFYIYICQEMPKVIAECSVQRASCCSTNGGDFICLSQSQLPMSRGREGEATLSVYEATRADTAASSSHSFSAFSAFSPYPSPALLLCCRMSPAACCLLPAACASPATFVVIMCTGQNLRLFASSLNVCASSSVPASVPSVCQRERERESMPKCGRVLMSRVNKQRPWCCRE